MMLVKESWRYCLVFESSKKYLLYELDNGIMKQT